MKPSDNRAPPRSDDTPRAGTHRSIGRKDDGWVTGADLNGYRRSTKTFAAGPLPPSLLNRFLPDNSLVDERHTPALCQLG